MFPEHLGVFLHHPMIAIASHSCAAPSIEGRHVSGLIGRIDSVYSPTRSLLPTLNSALERGAIEVLLHLLSADRPSAYHRAIQASCMDAVREGGDIAWP